MLCPHSAAAEIVCVTAFKLQKRIVSIEWRLALGCGSVACSSTGSTYAKW
jgi:hypothetical protein